MKLGMEPWQIWALLSAFFAAMTAVFAKVGVGAISPDLVLRSLRHPHPLNPPSSSSPHIGSGSLAIEG